MLDNRTRLHIAHEIAQIERLMRDYQELLAESSIRVPDLIARTALGAVLQSFYTGLENIFQTVAKRIDGGVPISADWHRQLLAQMARSTDRRAPVITPTTVEALEAYLGFRHVSRHGYSYTLEWVKMRALIQDLPVVWQQFHKDVLAFLNVMSTPDDQDV